MGQRASLRHSVLASMCEAWLWSPTLQKQNNNKKNVCW